MIFLKKLHSILIKNLTKIKYISAFIFCVGLGYFLSIFTNPRPLTPAFEVNPIIKQDCNNCPTEETEQYPISLNKGEYNYHTYETESEVQANMDQDDESEYVFLTHSSCYRIDKDDKHPVGCPGPICVEPDEVCDKPFMILDVRFFNEGETIRSEKIYAGLQSGNLEAISVDNEQLIIVSGLNLGAHSGELRVFRVNNNKIVPVCRNKVISDDRPISECIFYGDNGLPFVKKDENGRLIAIESFSTYMGTVEPYARQSVYKNGKFFLLE